MSRKPGYHTPNGRMRYAEVAAAQQRVRDAGHERDEIVGHALAEELGVRGIAAVLRIDNATVSRRCGRAAR
jgi:hypothetical protein